MGCGISEPYLIIEIFISDNSFSIVWKNKTIIGVKRYVKHDIKFTDMPNIKPVADKILIEFQSKKYNPSIEPLLRTLHDWLSTCVVDKLKIISIHDDEFLIRFLETFSFFKMNKLHLQYWATQLTNQPIQQKEFIASFFEQFSEKYPCIELSHS